MNDSLQVFQDRSLSRSVHICQAAPTDMIACATIFNDWVDATPWMPRIHSHDSVVAYYENVVGPNQKVLVAKSDGKIVGFLSAVESFVSALYLGPDARRQGIGKALLDTAKVENPGGLSLHAFEANTEARTFYRREGFTETSRTAGDNEEGLPDILYQWTAPGELNG